MIYRLKIIMNSSSEHYDSRRNMEGDSVTADGFTIIGEGKVYKFYNQNGDVTTRETVACYPTSNTIIEAITNR